MKYINEYSQRGFVNLLADYMLSEINKDVEHDTLIEITDCGHFLVVNGMTTSENRLDLNKIKEDFKSKVGDLFISLGYKDINFIDLIKYDVQVNKPEIYWFTNYNSIRPKYPNHIIDMVDLTYFSYHSISNFSNPIFEPLMSEEFDNLPNFNYPPFHISSEFPHGYSLSMGRSQLYYSEYISTNIFNTIKAKELTIKITEKRDSDEDLLIEVMSDSIYPNEVVKSLILDVFDFDYKSFNEKLDDYDYCLDIMEPFVNKPWLIKDRIEDVVIF